MLLLVTLGVKMVELTVYDYGDWDYIPRCISPNLFDHVYNEMKDLCVARSFKMFGKMCNMRRLSCVLSEKKDKKIYSTVKHYEWSVSKHILPIKDLVENIVETMFDYCLVHIYRDGKDGIGWHNDSEALTTAVASVSLGATRKFRFREINQKKGWNNEFTLKSGDLIYMKPGCQQRYKHTVPVEKRVTQPRINLTFRQF